MRFQGTCYRAHDPRQAFKPHSGEGASIHGGRLNVKGFPALYLALDLMTAVKEANQDFAHKIDPCALCSYEVDCDDVLDLRAEALRMERGVALEDLACPWFAYLMKNKEPPSWRIARKLIAEGAAGALVPSFMAQAGAQDYNLVLWTWGDRRPHRVKVHDPSGRLLKDQLSWD